MKLFFTGKPEGLTAFNDYRLKSAQPTIKAFLVTIGLFNILLLIPDLINLSESAALGVILLRVGYALMIAALYVWLSKIKTFRTFSRLVTALEFLAIAIFLYVFNLYPAPDFTIQLLGMMVIILLVFLVPNNWGGMILTASVGAVGFLCCAWFFVANVDFTKLVIGMIYLAAESALCAIFTLHSRAHQYIEYISRTELEREYATDPLTCIGNRIKLEEEADKWLDRVERYDFPLSLVLVDVDDLKIINDTCGHLKGDATLFEIAQIMRGELRKNDVCARWGGDEFILLLPYTDINEAKKLAERIRASIHQQRFDLPMSITCSFGIADIEKGMGLSQLIEKADASLYLAKKHGKNTIRTSRDENLPEDR